MKSKGLVMVLFLIMVTVQWIVPFQMVKSRQNIISSGEMYKFKIAPIDPHDPYRGKYLNLQFEQNHHTVSPGISWRSNEIVYVYVRQDTSGFARIIALSKDKPVSENTDYIKSSVRSVHGEDSLKVYIDYPFDRYYINEKMAGPLEKILRGSERDSSKINYALIRIKSGDAVLEEVYIEGRSVPEWYGHLK